MATKKKRGTKRSAGKKSARRGAAKKRSGVKKSTAKRRGAKKAAKRKTAKRGAKKSAKRSTAKTYLADAIEQGAEVVVRCFAERVLVEGGSAAGVEALYADPESGRTSRVTVRAPCVVVACGAILPCGVDSVGAQLPAPRAGAGGAVWAGGVTGVGGACANAAPDAAIITHDRTRGFLVM